MGKTILLVLLGGIAVGSAAVFASYQRQAPAPASLQKAPAFSAKASDGKTHTLQSLTRNGPVFLYFIKAGCPVNDPVAKHYNAIATAYAGRANFVGVINADEAGFKSWNAEHRLGFPVLFDKDKTIIRVFQARRSPWVVQVRRDGTIEKVWSAVSVNVLEEINQAVARAAGTNPKKLNFSGAPTRMTAGCSF